MTTTPPPKTPQKNQVFLKSSMHRICAVRGIFKTILQCISQIYFFIFLIIIWKLSKLRGHNLNP